ncbi:hypothetical protein SDC9_165070 [bioreactor metagenome]|uniref:Uncharacterized protein n=1 Tax=bioreactor metagenome TaxID=1076179 RepID=A0A645FTD3_9ZZZZ
MTAVRVTADVLLRAVGLVEKTVLDHHGSAVADQTVTLHLTESETSLPGTSLGGLTGQDLHGAAGTDVHLAADHVVQLLVEYHSGVDLHLDLPSGGAVVHDLPSGVLETVPDQSVTYGFLPLSGEHRAVHGAALHGADPAADHLEDVGDGHTGRYAVGVDHQIWRHTVYRERHVALIHQASDDAFLPVSGTELVAQLGYPLVPDLHPYEPGAVL